MICSFVRDFTIGLMTYERYILMILSVAMG